MRRVTPDIPIYRGRTRNGTIETERPTRTVCRLITFVQAFLFWVGQSSSGRLGADVASTYPAALDQSLADLTWRSSFAANWHVIRVT